MRFPLPWRERKPAVDSFLRPLTRFKEQRDCKSPDEIFCGVCICFQDFDTAFVDFPFLLPTLRPIYLCCVCCLDHFKYNSIWCGSSFDSPRDLHCWRVFFQKTSQSDLELKQGGSTVSRSRSPRSPKSVHSLCNAQIQCLYY